MSNKTQRVKEIIKKFDPALVAMAVQEKDINSEDVEKAKKDIIKIYESISERKDRIGILSKALEEINAELINKEVNKVKAALKDFDKDTLIEAMKDLGMQDVEACLRHSIRICPLCISHQIPCLFCISYRIPCLFCISHPIECHRCIMYRIIHPCNGYHIVSRGCESSIAVEVDPGSIVVDPAELEDIAKGIIESKEMSRAIKKMIREMKKNGEI